MSISFNLIQDTNITARFLSESSNVIIQQSEINVPIISNTSEILFIGRDENIPTFNIIKVNNDKDEILDLKANRISRLNLSKGDIIEMRPNNGQPIFANTNFIISNDDIGPVIRFSIEFPERNIIISEGHGLALSVDGLGEIKGKAYIPDYIIYDSFGREIEKVVDLTEGTYILPYNSYIELYATPLNIFKSFEATNSSNDTITIYRTSYNVFNSKSIKENSNYLIFIGILVIIFLIMYFKYNKDLKY